MKKLTLLVLTVLLLTACGQTKEEKAVKTIKESLSMSLKDVDSYQPIKTEIYDVPEQSWAFEQMAELQYAIEHPDEYQRKMDIVEGCRQYITFMDSTVKANNYEVFAYNIIHSFRAKNGFGGYTISTYWFTLDKELTKVIGATELK